MYKDVHMVKELIEKKLLYFKIKMPPFYKHYYIQDFLTIYI